MAIKLRERIGRQITGARKKKGWSQARLGQELDVSRQYIHGIEKGHKTTSLDRLDEICRVLGCRLNVHISC